MKFSLIDRILEYRAGEGIRVAKTLSLAEEYLADHFPGYPVMPGVLMIEVMTQAGAWYLRLHEDFLHPLAVLREVSHVKFPRFVTPGETLVMELELTAYDAEASTARFRAKGRVVEPGVQGVPGESQGPVCCQARITVAGSSVSEVAPELDPAWAETTEATMREHLRKELVCLERSAASLVGGGAP